MLTTGGTGPALRDVTPEATLAVAHKEDAWFWRTDAPDQPEVCAHGHPLRQVAVIRDQCLIVNLPGQPKAIAETLEGLKSADGAQLVPGIFAAVPYCIDLIGGPYLETREAVYRPSGPSRRSARRAPEPGVQPPEK